MLTGTSQISLSAIAKKANLAFTEVLREHKSRIGKPGSAGYIKRDLFTEMLIIVETYEAHDILSYLRKEIDDILDRIEND